ncbi:uncharacterized protein L201_002655 [Kwoniella dendrophila CBS 6074]|uniref:Uncharacterized protein n=1 Tax=Kwoniella dendrophila CBS 6074 TaxID=1295534 RepID=A0AAX4JTF2_9TREE
MAMELSQQTDSNTAKLVNRLTPRQEEKLRTYLDEKLSGLERDERTHKLGPLPELLARLSPLLQIILQIPPFKPFSSLRISYLLTLTSVIPIYMTSLPLLSAGHRTNNNVQKEAVRVIESVLKILKEVESGWLAVLDGEGWIPPRIDHRDRTSDNSSTKEDTSDCLDGLIIGGKSLKVEFGDQVDVTEKIRLKSIILSSKSRLLAWSRTYGNFDDVGSSLPGSSVPITHESKPHEDSYQRGKRSTSKEAGWEEEVLTMWNKLLDHLAQDLI